MALDLGFNDIIKKYHCDVIAEESQKKFLVPYCLNNLVFCKKAAFTLAEVLITLAIIGVVAAMTIPTLITNYQEKVTVTRLKKFYSAFSQAYQLAMLENGTIDQWGLKNSATTEDDNGNIVHTPESLANYDNFFKIMSKYLRNAKYEELKASSNQSENGFGYTLSDGSTSIIGMWLNPENCKTSSTAVCGYLYITTDISKVKDFVGDVAQAENVYCFTMHKNHIAPMDNFNSCKSGSNRTQCTAWIIKNGNMDYLKCPDELSWDGKHSCDN